MSLIALIGISTTLATTPPASPIRYERFQYGRAVYHSVCADMASGGVSVETVHSKRLTSVRKLVASPQPVAAITGTFFCPSSQRPVADVLVDGNLVAHGMIGTALGVSWYGQPKIFDTSFGAAVDWGEYRFGLRGAVRIVSHGAVNPNPKAQKFKDKRIWGRAARSGLGLTQAGKLVLFATKGKVTLSEFGKAMRSRGIVEGINLDGGTSTCLYYQGSFVVPPGRPLSNLVVLRKVQPTAANGRSDGVVGSVGSALDRLASRMPNGAK